MIQNYLEGKGVMVKYLKTDDHDQIQNLNQDSFSLC